MALLAMALLTSGYAFRKDLKPTPEKASVSNNELAGPRVDPNTPKP
jgi:hypothetical protein